MRRLDLSFEGRSVAVRYPDSLHEDIVRCLGRSHAVGADRADHVVPWRDSLIGLLGDLVHALVTDLDSGVALHAGAVGGDGYAALLPGTSGAGKSCLTAWLVERGFGYLTDELSVLRPRVPEIAAFPRPLIFKPPARAVLATLASVAARPTVDCAGTLVVAPPPGPPPDPPQRCRLVVFPRFEDGADLHLAPLSAAETALALTACNVNARNLPDHGFAIVTDFAAQVPALALRYGSFTQLDGTLDRLVRQALAAPLDRAGLRRLIAGG